MSITMYSTSVPVFQQMLGSLQVILQKAQAHATEKKIEDQVFLQARLAPDMFNLIRQVQIATDFAKGISARLAGVDVPDFQDTENSFEELQARLHKTIDFMRQLTPTQFEEAEEREIVLRPGTPKEKKLSGEAYLLSYGLPQFFFHVTTTYAILRHHGIELGKRDYMGTY
ncbi:DUF1993 domain-containing protein [Undibacterium baiyunense]|uniref:DUF1993 domain-containing protein n=1 Tax=Undibacterium baiyunense TaxID=2828731 RepID=A0A941DF99_9BURK|nr:DUF1993 domain-containing protein [Undibacterium baiyunense]MBR7746568.1 DUF1993 domain-containing protein [Undibacterium baiyunense]